MLAPNSPQRPALTALAPEAVVPAPASNPAVETAAETPPETIRRSPARYLWVRLLARIDEASPLTGPQCGAERPIIAFITEAMPVRATAGVHRGNRQPAPYPPNAGTAGMA